MNNILKIAALCLLPSFMNATFVKLSASKVDMMPIIGIDGNAIALIKQYQSQIMTILRGELSEGRRIGTYTFDRKKCNVHELHQLETVHGVHDMRLIAIRNQIRDDFEKISSPFQAIIYSPGIKTGMGFLIKESCTKRNRSDSLLYIWVTNDAKNEYELFDFHIKSIKDVEIFLTDIYNFLGDLIFSCPRAYAQFKEQVNKFNRAKLFVIDLRLPKTKQYAFLKYLNTQITNFSTHEINQEKIKELYDTIKQNL